MLVPLGFLLKDVKKFLPYLLWVFFGTPTKRQVPKRQVSKRLKHQGYKTSGLQNVRFTKHQVFKTPKLAKKHPYIFRTCGWWKSAGSVAAMFAGNVMSLFYSLF
jgi:hypothetical protein